MASSQRSGLSQVALVSPSDVGKAVGIAAMASISWLLPESRWPGLCRLLARGLGGAPDGGAGIAALIDGQRIPADPDSIYRSSRATSLESYLQLLRDYRPGGWKPASSLQGAEHLEAALRRGRGAVLWLPLFAGYGFVAKVVLSEAGFEVSHLSHPRHGFSETRFGMRFLNPIRTRAENRYLKSRIMMSRDSSAEALRESLARVRANEIVSITAGGAAAQPVSVPFLNGDFLVAGGAPSLAHATGAALLPVFPLLEGAGSVRVVIAAPVERQSGETKRQFVARAALTFSKQMEAYVRRHPEQWRGWVGNGRGQQAVADRIEGLGQRRLHEPHEERDEHRRAAPPA